MLHDHEHDNCCEDDHDRGHGHDCCGDDHGHNHDNKIHDSGHGHDHGHAKSCGDEDCCDGGDCCGDDHGHDHGHDDSSGRDHGHDHGHAKSCGDGDCCGDDHGHDHGHDDSSENDHGHDHGHKACCGDDHGHSSHQHSGHDHNHGHTVSQPQSSTSTTAIDVPSQTCSQCDPSSTIPHAVATTRFRIANLCCSGEEKIIRTTLEGIYGINDVSVNVIGRYAIVKHCPIDCCCPSTKIIQLLNEKRLGASIQEANKAGEDEGDNEEEQREFLIHGLHVSTVTILFIIGCIVQKTYKPSHTPAMGVFLAGIIYGIIPILKNAAIAVIRRTIDINLLMIVAIVGAVASGEYFDACLVVALFIAAELMESFVMARVRKAVKSSMGRTDTTAYLASGKSVAVNDLKVGNVIAVRAGDMILADGLIVKGEGVVDESALTGEATPIQKKKGSKALSGTVMQNGYLEIEIDTPMEDSTLRKLNQAVSDVQADKGEYAKLVDQFSYYWTPGVLICATLFVVIGGGVSRNWHSYVQRGLVLLVLACPCSIVIAAPIPSVCAIAAAAKHGVLIRGSSVIERIGLINTLAVDKTGTLTLGFFKAIATLKLGSGDKGYDALELAAAIEEKSSHPLANAVVSAFCGCIAEMQSDFPNSRTIKVVPGIGLSGWVETGGKGSDVWKFVCVGNERLFVANGGTVQLSTEQDKQVQRFLKANSHADIVFVAVDNCIEIALALADEIRPESPEFIRRMYGMGMTAAMLTGDHITVASEVCSRVNILQQNCLARLLPSEKLGWVQQKQKEGRHVVMLGDGINDSTALAAAAVGVAMGAGGSAMAAHAADVVIMSDNLLRIPSTFLLCRQARSIILQNCAFSIGIKLIAVILAVMGRLAFWAAILVDMGALLVVIINGTRPLVSLAFDNSNLDVVAKYSAVPLQEPPSSSLEMTTKVDCNV